MPLGTALNTSGIFYYAWVIPGAIALIIFLIAFAKFINYLPVKTRKLFLIAGSCYVGDVGIELIGGYYADLYTPHNMGYALITTIEETLEMLGIAVFIYALLSYISLNLKGVDLRVYVPPTQKKSLRST